MAVNQQISNIGEFRDKERLFLEKFSQLWKICRIFKRERYWI